MQMSSAFTESSENREMKYDFFITLAFILSAHKVNHTSDLGRTLKTGSPTLGVQTNPGLGPRFNPGLLP